MKLVLDTNIFISFLLMKKDRYFFRKFNEKGADLFYSEELISEIIHTSKYRRIAKRVESFQVEKLIKTLKTFGTFLNPRQLITFEPDPNDEFILDLCLESGADYLVTGDGDLLELGKISRTKIITFAALKEMLDS